MPPEMHRVARGIEAAAGVRKVDGHASPCAFKRTSDTAVVD
jgi:hypothetical protein